MKQPGIEHHIDANVAIASLQNVIVIVFKGPPRVEDIERMRDLVIQLARDYPRGLGVVQVSMRESSGGRDTQDIRRTFTTMMREVAPMVRAAAVVVKTNAFVAAAIRAVAGGIVLLAKPAVPFLIFDDVRPAIDWLVTKLEHVGAPIEEPGELRLSVFETISRLKMK